MNVLEPIRTVLEQARTPLHYREITKRVLEKHLWTTNGRTPWDTINAALAMDIKTHGSDSLFERMEPGIFGLRGIDSPVAAPRITTFSFTDAAEHVLVQYAGKKPMHYREVAARALELNLIKTEGRTPEATLYASILEESKRRQRRGGVPRFVMEGKGFISLAAWSDAGLARQIEEHNANVRRKLLAQLREVDPTEFETLVGELLIALGFSSVTITGRSGDGGIDARGTLVVGDAIRISMAVQAKRWKQNIQAPIVQQVRGSLGTHEQGLIITTSEFGKGAREEAARANAVPVGLMNGEQLVGLLVEHEIRVTRNAHYLIQLKHEDDD